MKVNLARQIIRSQCLWDNPKAIGFLADISRLPHSIINIFGVLPHFSPDAFEKIWFIKLVTGTRQNRWGSEPVRMIKGPGFSADVSIREK